jgi:hypothetical protein
MAENILKEPQKVSTQDGENSSTGFLKSLLNGSFLTFEKSPGLLPFLFFIGALAILLIANTYNAEKKVREIETMRHEVTELRTKYISNKAELMRLSNQSEVARRLAQHGFVESTVPPRIVEDKPRRRDLLLRIFRAKN